MSDPVVLTKSLVGAFQRAYKLYNEDRTGALVRLQALAPEDQEGAKKALELVFAALDKKRKAADDDNDIGPRPSKQPKLDKYAVFLRLLEKKLTESDHNRIVQGALSIPTFSESDLDGFSLQKKIELLAQCFQSEETIKRLSLVLVYKEGQLFVNLRKQYTSHGAWTLFCKTVLLLDPSTVLRKVKVFRILQFFPRLMDLDINFTTLESVSKEFLAVIPKLINGNPVNHQSIFDRLRAPSNGLSIAIRSAVVEMPAQASVSAQVVGFNDRLLSEPKARHNLQGVADGGESMNHETDHRLDFAHTNNDLMNVIADEMIGEDEALQELSALSLSYKELCRNHLLHVAKYEASGVQDPALNTVLGIEAAALEEAGKQINTAIEILDKLSETLETKTELYRVMALRCTAVDDEDTEAEEDFQDEAEDEAALYDPDTVDFIDSPATSTDGLAAAAASMSMDE